MIILQILKIIGIVLACIVGLVLFILLLVMFAPFTYKLSGKGGQEGSDISAGASVKWLLGFVTVRALFENKKLTYYVRTAGIKILKGDLSDHKKKTEEPEEEAVQESHHKTMSEELYRLSPNEYSRDKVEQKIKIQGKDTKQVYKEMEADIRREEKEIKDQLKEEKKREKAHEKEEKRREKEQKSLSERFDEFVDKIRGIIEKIKNIYELIGQVKYILGAPVTKRALKVIKKQLFNILGHLKPRAYKGYIAYSTGDPATTAQIYGAGSTFVSMLDERLKIIPYVELTESKVEADVNISGHLFVGYLALCGIKIILNRDVQRVLKYVKRLAAKGAK